MPRLTNQRYLVSSLWLSEIWNSNLKTLFALLSVQRQCDLHAYFQPTKDLTYEALLEHRRVISREFPDLPAKAGRYCSRMWEIYDEAVNFAKDNEHLTQAYISDVVAPLQTDRSGRRIGLAAVAKPEPDLRRFALALIQMAQLELLSKRHSDKAV